MTYLACIAYECGEKVKIYDFLRTLDVIVPIPGKISKSLGI